MKVNLLSKDVHLAADGRGIEIWLSPEKRTFSLLVDHLITQISVAKGQHVQHLTSKIAFEYKAVKTS